MGAFVPSPALPRGSSQAEFTPSMSLLGVTAWFEHILLALGSGVRGDVFRCSDRGHTEGGNDAEGNFQLFFALSTSGHRLNGDKGTKVTYSPLDLYQFLSILPIFRMKQPLHSAPEVKMISCPFWRNKIHGCCRGA